MRDAFKIFSKSISNAPLCTADKYDVRCMCAYTEKTSQRTATSWPCLNVRGKITETFPLGALS